MCQSTCTCIYTCTCTVRTVLVCMCRHFHDVIDTYMYMYITCTTYIMYTQYVHCMYNVHSESSDVMPTIALTSSLCAMSSDNWTTLLSNTACTRGICEEREEGRGGREGEKREEKRKGEEGEGRGRRERERKEKG